MDVSPGSSSANWDLINPRWTPRGRCQIVERYITPNDTQEISLTMCPGVSPMDAIILNLKRFDKIS